LGARLIEHRVWPFLMLAILVIGGCREDEQGRALGFEPGVYQGEAMPEIDGEIRAGLRERVANQDF